MATRPLLLSCAWGAAGGAALFLLESALALRSGVAGLHLDTSGPFAQLMAAATPALPGLLARVAIAYAAAGALAGGLAAVAARAVVDQIWRVLAAADWLACWILLAAHRAIVRPALFEDLPVLSRPLAWLVQHGEPWQVTAAAVSLLSAHAALALLRRGPRAILAFAAAALVAYAAAFPPGAPRAPARGPLVLLIGLDAFRPDRIGRAPGGAPVAPNLERFLQDASQFEHAYTPIAQTSPAWHSLLAGAWPWRTGVRYPLAATEREQPLPSFAARFGAAGFSATFATDCSRFNYLGPSSGFDRRLQPPQGALNFVLEKLRYRGLGLFADNDLGARLLPELIENRALAGVHDPMAYASRLGGRIVEQARAGPALFAYHNTAAHFPGDPVYPFYRKYPEARRTLRMSFAPIERTSSAGAASREEAEALYDELISQADAQLGLLLESLRGAGLYDQALIVVFSDHGESFHPDIPALAGATPVHGARLSDDENRILLAVKLPASLGLPARKIPDLVRLIDLGPTLLDAMNLKAPPFPDGVSLMPLLRGQSMPELLLYAETGYTHATPDVFDADHYSGGVRTFDAYAVRADGRVEMTDRAHAIALNEKDVGAFDGRGWLIRSPRSDGTMQERCRGECSPALASWLDATASRQP